MTSRAPTAVPVRERKPEDLDPRMLQQFRRLKQTFDEGAVELVVTIASEWVQRHPEVPAFRKLLRDAQCRISPQPRLQANPASSLLRRLLGRTLKNGGPPLLVLEKCERMLASDPLNLFANQLLAETASGLGWNETALLGWQTLLLNPKAESCHILAFGNYLLDHQRNHEVLELCDTFLITFPNDASLHELRDQAAIRQSIHSAVE
jgi:hypothetical protein